MNHRRRAFAQSSTLARLAPFASTHTTPTISHAAKSLVAKACAGALLIVTFPLPFAVAQGTPLERVVVEELALPPTAPSTAAGSCTNKTGCIDPSDYGISEGPGYMWDGHYVLLPITFAGAAAAPDPRSIYSGDQVIAIRTDGSKFKNGDAWKCITCGVSDKFHANRQHPAPYGNGQLLVDHPQPMHDGSRALVGTNILDCGAHQIVADDCTPEETKIYPIVPYRNGAFVRELRLHPDDVHLGFSDAIISGSTFVDEYGLFGRLEFNAAASRYELRNVSFLLSTDPMKTGQPISVDPTHPNQLTTHAPAGVVGEFRGFSSDGKFVLGTGLFDSGNIDLFFTDLVSGISRRVTHDPAYTDPSHTSPDAKWLVFMDGRVNDRMYFAAALPGVPPLTDMASASSIQYLYNNGYRRFFEPFVVSTAADREDSNIHDGFQLNGGQDANIADPLWNGRADPAWSPDGTNIVYWQAQVMPPACGAGQPTAPSCPASHEPGGRRTRLMIARFTSRKPISVPRALRAGDEIPWGIPYHSGDALPKRTHLPAGTYKLTGQVSGEATVVITENADKTAIAEVEVTYANYSRDGLNILNGTESASSAPFTWHVDLTLAGQHKGTRKTTEPGGFVVTPPPANDPLGRAIITGNLTTTLDGHTYSSPSTGQ